eukprot:7698837-Alexandrium_andersonii.AAC.1
MRCVAALASCSVRRPLRARRLQAVNGLDCARAIQPDAALVVRQHSPDIVPKMVLGSRSRSTLARAPAEPCAEPARASRSEPPNAAREGQAAAAQSSLAAPPPPA